MYALNMNTTGTFFHSAVRPPIEPKVHTGIESDMHSVTFISDLSAL